jgi:hypothetical protein
MLFSTGDISVEDWVFLPNVWKGHLPIRWQYLLCCSACKKTKSRQYLIDLATNLVTSAVVNLCSSQLRLRLSFYTYHTIYCYCFRGMYMWFQRWLKILREGIWIYVWFCIQVAGFRGLVHRRVASIYLLVQCVFAVVVDAGRIRNLMLSRHKYFKFWLWMTSGVKSSTTCLQN